jgi:hypothetical protein
MVRVVERLASGPHVGRRPVEPTIQARGSRRQQLCTRLQWVTFVALGRPVDGTNVDSDQHA